MVKEVFVNSELGARHRQHYLDKHGASDRDALEEDLARVDRQVSDREKYLARLGANANAGRVRYHREAQFAEIDGRAPDLEQYQFEQNRFTMRSRQIRDEIDALLVRSGVLQEMIREIDAHGSADAARFVIGETLNATVWNPLDSFTSTEAWNHFKVVYLLTVRHKSIPGKRGNETPTAIFQAVANITGVSASAVGKSAKENGWYDPHVMPVVPIRDLIARKATEIPAGIRKKLKDGDD